MLGLFDVSAGTAASTVFSNGSSITSTQVAYGDSAGKITSDSAFTRGTLAFGVDAGQSSFLASLGHAALGFAPTGTTSAVYLWNDAVGTPVTNYALRIGSTGGTTLNSASGQVLALAVGAASKLSFAGAGTSATFASGCPVTISDTTVAGAGTGALVVAGGAAVASLNVSGASTQTGAVTYVASTRWTGAASGYIGSASSCALQRSSSGGAAPFDVSGNLVYETPTAGRAHVFAGGATTGIQLQITATGSIVPGTAALATSATDGFIYMQTCAGTPSGVPTTFTGRVAWVYDTTNHKICVYDGGAWKQSVALT